MRPRLRQVGMGIVVALVAAVPVGAQVTRPATAPDHQAPSPRIAARLLPGPVSLDGRLDEPFWSLLEPATDFRQSQPTEGAPATQRTEVRFGFDGTALYVGARMFDDQGRPGVRTRLVRRDQTTDSDGLELIFDTYHNHLGRTSFAVNPSGVRRDAGQAVEYADESWDPVWEVATAIDSLGWTAEFRIPFSQIRFARDSVQTWGLQIWRNTSRLNDFSMWSFWKRNESGGPPRFGHLDGIARPSGGTARAELLPYLVAKFDALQPGDAADPFYDPRAAHLRAGADAKVLLGSNLTLDATINPDFGQVEVDPAVVNLSAFETFFPERRPFFIEGSGTFSFGESTCYFCSNFSSTSLFYSRRIGRQPQGALPDGTAFARVPDASTILGAVKITGRTAGGLSLGVMNATTSRETATALVGSQRLGQEVEPLTNYFVARVKRDRNRGDFVLGAMATSVLRLSDDPLIDSRLPARAEAIGTDWNVRWSERTYSVMGNVAVSNVTGDAAAIDRLQRASARYNQRPDRHGRYDPAATSLRGAAGYLRAAKDAGDWLFETSMSFRSPGFETNDIAFNQQSDLIWMSANGMRIFNRPTSWYRQINVIAGGQQRYTFDGDLTERQLHAFAGGQLANYWGFSLFAIRRFAALDDRATRGGPLVGNPGIWFISGGLNTDGRRAFALSISPSFGRTDEGKYDLGLGLELSFRPAANVAFSVGPSLQYREGAAQYVTTVSDPTATAFFGNRYLFSDLEQRSVAFDTRVNVTMTPNLTFELFAQPLITSVDFRRFKEFAAPRSRTKLVYGEDVGTVADVRAADGTVTGYRLDPDGAGPVATFAIDNPDFNFRSIRGNAILRWEYRPGSTLFFVWTRTAADVAPFVGNFDFGRDHSALFDARADNVFLIKVSLWLTGLR